MASHLTVMTTAPSGVTSSKGLNAQATAGGDAESGPLGAFAALLGAASQSSGTSTAASGEASAELGLGNLVNLSFGAGFGSGQGGKPDDPEAIAAVVDAALPIQTSIDAKPMLADLIDSLADLKLKLDAGEIVDPELLKRIDGMLTELADQFDVDFAALPGLADLKALMTSALPDDTSIGAWLTSALAPLAEALLAGGNTQISADVELSAMVKSIGEKLGALLQSLNATDMDPAKLAALGLDADASLDADLQAAIAKLISPPVDIDTTANGPVLAAPSLKLTEPVLSGNAGVQAAVPVENTPDQTKPAEAGVDLANLAVSADDADTGSQGSAGSKSDGSDNKPAEAKATAALPLAATVTETESQVAAQPAPVVARIDATAARPVVQPGYQTSQQQLNLPQLAFELVRQVNDGNTRFQMRLDPPELGKIDVRLDIDSTGQVNARLTVERAETLDLMQRDQRGLEKALQQAGLDGAKTNLEFSLKQNSSGGQQGQDSNPRHALLDAGMAGEVEDAPPPTINLYRGSLTASGVNIIA